MKKFTVLDRSVLTKGTKITFTVPEIFGATADVTATKTWGTISFFPLESGPSNRDAGTTAIPTPSKTATYIALLPPGKSRSFGISITIFKYKHVFKWNGYA